MKVKVTEMADAMPALNKLVMVKLSSWAKAREVARFYEEIAKEIDAWKAAVKRTDEKNEQEIKILNDAEINIPQLVIREGDFLKTEDMPSPGDMFLLRHIISFGEVEDENNTNEKA